MADSPWPMYGRTADHQHRAASAIPPVSLEVRLSQSSGGAAILNKQLAIKAGYNVAFAVDGTFPDGSKKLVSPTYTSVGDIGTVSSDGKFIAAKKSGVRGSIQFSVESLRDSIKVVILPAPLKRITIKPTSVSLSAGQQVSFTTEGFDDYSNSLGKVQCFWHTVGNIGTISKLTGVFKAGTTPGTGYVIAYAQMTFGDTQAGLSGSAKVLVEKTLPGKYALSQNYPNPFNPQTTIGYDLPEVASIHLTIYDLSGRKVRTLVRGYQEAGSYSVSWDGRDELGRVVASGVYLYRLEAVDRGFVETRRMVLMR